MNTLKICAAAVLLVVVTPLIVGYAWPAYTETRDSYEVDGGMDITSSISGSDIKIYERYTGPMNNYFTVENVDDYLNVLPASMAGGSSMQHTTTVPGAVPVMDVTQSDIATDGTAVLSDLSVPVGTLCVRLWFDDGTPSSGGSPGTTGNLVRFDYTDKNGASGLLYDYALWYPNTGVTFLFNSDGYRSTAMNVISISAESGTPEKLNVDAFTQAEDGSGNPLFMDLAYGLFFPAGEHIYMNTMESRSMEIWIRTASLVAPGHLDFSDLPLGEHTPIRLTVDGDGNIYWGSPASGSRVGNVDIYPYISLVFDMETKKATAYGLVGAESFVDTTYTYGNSVSVNMPFFHVSNISVTSESSFKTVLKSAISVIGTAKGIRDAHIDSSMYFPENDWQIYLYNPAAYGDSISVGPTRYQVDSTGTIEVTDLDGGLHEIALRDAAILSLVRDGTQTLYVNGIAVAQQSPQDTEIVLGGSWWINVMLSHVTQTSETVYTWDVGHFGLSKVSYLVVGLLSCLAVTIIAGLWGRRTGEKMILLGACMIFCGGAYLILLMGAI